MGDEGTPPPASGVGAQARPGRSLALGVALCAGLGIAAVFYIGRDGIRLSSDSGQYVGAARNIALGRGLTLPYTSPPNAPLAQYPPFYPVLMAVPSLLGPDPLVVTRWLHALLFAGTMGLAAYAVFLTTASPFLSLVAAAFILCAPAMLTVHSFVWSEAPFLFLVTAALTIMCLYQRRPGMPRLLAAGGVTALAVLTRWAGAPLVAVGGAIVLAFAGGGWRKRLGAAAAFGLASCLPPALWVARNVLVAGTAANRDLVYHPPTPRHVLYLLITLKDWILPDSHRIFLALGLFGLLVAGGAAGTAAHLWRCSATEARERLRTAPWPFIAFGIAYSAFLVVSISFFDRATHPGYRIMCPVYVAWLVATLWLWSVPWTGGAARPAWRRATMAIWILLALVQFRAGAGYLADARDLTSPRIDRFGKYPLLAVIARVPASDLLYTNRPDLVYVCADRVAGTFPARMSVQSGLPNPHYEESLDAVRKDFERRGGWLLIIKDDSHRWPDRSELEAGMSMELQEERGIWSLYRRRE